MSKIIKVAALFGAALALGAGTKVDYEPAATPVYIVESIECLDSTSGSSTDSIYLSQQPGGGRMPKGTFSMSAGEKREVGRYFYPKEPGKFVLYEADSLTSDDVIGEYSYNLRETSGTYTVRMDGDGAEYVVVISVRR